MRRKVLLLTAFMVSACSAHSPFIVKNTVEGHPASASATKYPAHSKKILVTQSGLPADIKYEVIETIEVGKVWYGSVNEVDVSMADRARSIGADAVIFAKTWHQPSGWSWAAPHGSGQAVKILNPDSTKLKSVPGSWL